MRRIIFEDYAFEDFNYWILNDKNIYKKIVGLVKGIQRDPFRGIGKPESLKNELQGYWSRRISNEHRLVYKVTNDSIIIISCRFHY